MKKGELKFHIIDNTMTVPQNIIGVLHGYLSNHYRTQDRQYQVDIRLSSVVPVRSYNGGMMVVTTKPRSAYNIQVNDITAPQPVHVATIIMEMSGHITSHLEAPGG